MTFNTELETIVGEISERTVIRTLPQCRNIIYLFPFTINLFPVITH